MRAVIVGAGRTGTHVALDMAAAGHEVKLLDRNPSHLAAVEGVPNVMPVKADGCDPEKLEAAGVSKADIVIGLTGEDEDNLVVSWLAKYVFGVAKVIARVNNPKNTWLFTSEWGVDAPVSSAKIISTLIEEEAEYGGLVTIAKLGEGAFSLVEIAVTPDSPALGRSLGEIGIPAGARVVGVTRGVELIEPGAGLILAPGDVVIALVTQGAEADLLARFGTA